MRIPVDIDRDSGFCFGVVTAIKKAEEEIERTGHLYCLGDIVHNSDEVERLKAKGLVTITHQELEKLHDVKVLLRAHGEPPSTYEIARRNNIEIIDATCPVVLQLQRRIKACHESPDNQSQIVIFGKAGHAEVNGLVGQTDGQAIVVENPDELEKIDFTRDIALYSQTTKSIAGFKKLIDNISARKAEATRFDSFDTICRQVASRVDKVRAYAASRSMIIFVCGTKSSNGKILYDECAKVNPNTHLVSNADAIDPAWLTQDVESIGICGATSTPRWLMEQVANRINQLIDNG